MEYRTIVARGLLLACLLGLPLTASAQSALAGVVRDSSGAVLPGVTVEAASEALIEKQRTVFTDGQGQYNIIDLRPGGYVITFSLTGFNTVKREGIDLPASFTATVNVDMRVGSLEETVIVSGAAPTVDIHSATSTQVVAREVWDSLPTAKNVQAVAQLMPGVRMNVSDVGGSQGMQQQQFIVRGIGGTQNTVLFDGLNLNSLLGDGATVPYFNDSAVQEFSFQAGGLDADTAAGGGRLNVIPKDGGNRFSGSGFSAYTDGDWQGNNYTDELKARGLTSTARITRMYDLSAGVGGPVIRDKLWFFTGVRDYSVNNTIPDTVFRDGSPAIDDQYIKLGLARLTWQVTDKNKISIHYERMAKYRGHRFEPPTIFIEPEVSSRIHDNPLYWWSTVKWTSTVSSKLLVELGQVSYVNPNRILYQPGVAKEPFSPEWYATASRFDRDLNVIWAAAQNSTRSVPERYSWQGSASYVTGSQHLKVGGDWHWGRQRSMVEANADLQQEYRSGVPDTVLVYNTPIFFTDSLLNADAGLYVQDAWTLKRLTVTGGLRWQYYDAQIPEQHSGVGRFVGARNFESIEHVPTFKDVAPRLAAVYDVFGNAKTALKVNLSRYLDQRTLSLTTPYNPLSSTTSRVRWTDVNRDDIAQGELGCVYLTANCEIDLAALPQNFGSRALNVQDPDLKRTANIESSIAVQHELMPRVSVGGGWYRRAFQNLLQTDYIQRTQADYSPLTVVNPLDGEVITVYNLSTAKLPLTQRFDTNASDEVRQLYTGFETAITVRLPRGITIFGGTSHQRTTAVTCDQPDDPNLLRFCDQRESDLPLETDFKINISYPLPLWGLQVSGVFQSYQGKPTRTDWLLSRTTRYAADCKGPCTPGALVIPTLTEASLTVPLSAPGTEFLDRLNQLDMRVGKRYTIGPLRFSSQLDLFNVFNANPVDIVRSTNYLTTAYQLPASVLQARLAKISTQVSW